MAKADSVVYEASMKVSGTADGAHTRGFCHTVVRRVPLACSGALRFANSGSIGARLGLQAGSLRESLFTLLPHLADACSGPPAVAPGGIADGRGLAAAIMLRAAGVSGDALFHLTRLNYGATGPMHRAASPRSARCRPRAVRYEAMRKCD
jgi:hypothetical protein